MCLVILFAVLLIDYHDAHIFFLLGCGVMEVEAFTQHMTSVTTSHTRTWRSTSPLNPSMWCVICLECVYVCVLVFLSLSLSLWTLFLFPMHSRSLILIICCTVLCCAVLRYTRGSMAPIRCGIARSNATCGCSNSSSKV